METLLQDIFSHNPRCVPAILFASESGSRRDGHSGQERYCPIPPFARLTAIFEVKVWQDSHLHQVLPNLPSLGIRDHRFGGTNDPFGTTLSDTGRVVDKTS